MTMMLAGLIAFFLIHSLAFTPERRELVVEILGFKIYRAIFTFGSLSSFVLIVMGWQSFEPEMIYYPPAWGRHVTPLFALFGILLFIASNAPTNIRRMLRHPQLTGVTLWGAGHLFSNGETRSVMLFGFFILFSLYAMWASNKRDGEWIKRDPVPRSRDVVTILISLVVYGALYYFTRFSPAFPCWFNLSLGAALQHQTICH